MRTVTLTISAELERTLEDVRAKGVAQGRGNLSDADILASWLHVGTRAFVEREEARKVGDHRLVSGLTVLELATALGVEDLKAIRDHNAKAKDASAAAMAEAVKCFEAVRNIHAINVLTEFTSAEQITEWARGAAQHLATMPTVHLIGAFAWYDGTTYAPSPNQN